ncbi:MAG: carboxypeptidase regulatory-like domain-containing protein [Terracidiphilus sp.]
MFRWRIVCIPVLCTLLWLCAALPALAASACYGKVTFNGLPVPGATVIATEGAKKFTTVSDEGGVFHFDNLADGVWEIEVEMQLFAPIHAEVTVGPKTPVSEFTLTPLPMGDLETRAQAAKNAPETPSVAVVTRPEKKQAAEGNAPAPAPPPPAASEQSADGLLVNGSVNNAATSIYSTNPAFGNSHPGGHALYNGGFATFVDNASLDARPFSVSGVVAPKSPYTHLTDEAYVGGPLRIPRIMPNGPNFFLLYGWTRDNNAAIVSGLVPTIAERMGDLSGLTNAQGQPITVFNPATGQPYVNNQGVTNQVPVSPQAAALLNLYPQANIAAGIAGGRAYNYEAPVLNDVHEDVLQSHLYKTIGRKDTLSGEFNFRSTRSSSVNLFGFVDKTDVLGLHGNIRWMHRLTTRIFLYSGYDFTRLRTQLTPNFENRVNISGNAGIGGNDQDPADWGPPSLSFNSGFAGLSDGNSEYNRNQTDAFSAHALFYHGRHDVTVGGDYSRQDHNELQQSDPRGGFTFTGAATAGSANGVTSSGSDLADFLVGIPDTSAVAYGNADKYFREPVYDAYFTDDWRVLPILSINAGMRWDYQAPMNELFGRLVNLDIANGFTAVAPVEGSSPVGSETGTHYPSSLLQPQRKMFEPRVAFSWRPIPASTVVVRAGYGIYSDSSVYLRIESGLAQQYPLSTSLSVQNSSACPLTLADGFTPCSGFTQDTFAINPNFHIGYVQIWNLEVQRDLPFAMQVTATYQGFKGTHGPQEFYPNSYPIGEANPCPDCPSGFVYETSNGNSTRQEGQIQLRRRLMNGFAASAMYTWSKSIDDDAYLGGNGHIIASGPGVAPSSGSAGPSMVAQNWLAPEAERSLSSFDQRQLLNLTAQYTSGEGLGGGTLMSGWRGRLFKEWTAQTTISLGSGLPETPIYPEAVPGTGSNNSIRPDLTGAPLYSATNGAHVNAAAYAAPLPGEWGTAGRDSITGPGQFTLDSSLNRTFRPHGKTYLDLRIESTNTLNHPAFTSWYSTVGMTQFGLPQGAGGMRNLQTELRLRF